VTKPLTTAPPSPLLDEVVAAYDAAYADLLAAGAIPDENYPGLEDHMDHGQAEQWRTVIRDVRERGLRVRAADSSRPWRRVEAFDRISVDVVEIEVCRVDPEESVDALGVVVDVSHRAYRYVETLVRKEGQWKWSGREWVDPSASASDCAWPS
jgi:hypothetical protein